MILNAILSRIMRSRYSRIQQFIDHPAGIQRRTFRFLLDRGTRTQFGTDHRFRDIAHVREFRELVPVRTYEDFYPWIERALKGEEDVVWPGEILWFSKSSGTTNDRRKLIPVSQESLEDCHYEAGRDMLAIYYNNRPDSQIFRFRARILGIAGNHVSSEYNSRASYGDISAILLENLPILYQLFRVPSKKVALMDEWEDKLKQMALESMDEDVTAISGVPTWILVLINKIFELKGMDSGNLMDIWPHLEVFFHGGVNFEPYREHFKQLIPSDQVQYYNIYNASEGFFGIQYAPDSSDMLLLLDYGIFYEFIPTEELGKEHPKALSIEDVEIGTNYALVITTNGGLWRYLIGDTVKFTSLQPPLIQVTGRTKHFINAFGEELVVENADAAIAKASQETGGIVENYTAAPYYFSGNEKGTHEWLIEFSQKPESEETFISILDETLKSVNQDYDAKRYKNLALSRPRVHAVPEGTFVKWLGRRKTLGAQTKVPRLSNSREFVEEILKMIGEA